MTIVDNVVRDAMVHLLRQVPWGDDRDKLERKASNFEREASEERRWDNYSTGAHLSWQGTLHRYAAEARFPREGDRTVGMMQAWVTDRLINEINLVSDDDGPQDESTLVRLGRLSNALYRFLKPEIIQLVIDQLHIDGRLEDDPDYLKGRHNNPDDYLENNAIQHWPLSAGMPF
ncbi:hypothetical protein [Rhizobium sp. BK176]|uniref:hypothetical protein n=1 Tax=Rhizobium sp. BK176 TaxID=2587071 RepID=UPI00216A0C3D|nr:hypothetical protein [Rhizobium sp. BK176]MCS4089938.1 hypothetical protein [Rhizobium sp. BK176]